MNYTINDRNNKKVPVEIRGKFKKVLRDTEKGTDTLSSQEKDARGSAFQKHFSGNLNDKYNKPAPRTPYKDYKSVRVERVRKTSEAHSERNDAKRELLSQTISGNKLNPLNKILRNDEDGKSKIFKTYTPKETADRDRPFQRRFDGRDGPRPGGFRSGPGGFAGSRGDSSRPGFSPRPGGFNRSGSGEGGFRSGPGGFAGSRGDSSRPGFSPRPGGFNRSGSGEGGFRSGPGGFAGSRGDSSRPGFSPRPGGFNRSNSGEGGFSPRPGGFGSRPGGFSPRPGGFNRSNSGEGGFSPRSGGFGSRPGGFSPRPGGFNRSNEGGFSPRPGGFGSRPGGFSPRPGGFGGSSGGSRGEFVSRSSNGFGRSSFGEGGFGSRTPNSGFGAKSFQKPANGRKFSKPEHGADRRNSRFRNEFNHSDERFSHQLLGKINSADDVELESGSYYKRPRVARKSRDEVIRNVLIPFEGIEPSDLANKMAVKINILQSKLKDLEISHTSLIDSQIALALVEEMGHTGQIAQQEMNIIADEGNADDYESRCPVVTVVGHVDHGKTSLLDALRKSDTVSGESGGITQSIGASQVFLDSKKDSKKFVTFVDTPGHEAFTSMRIRGVKITDIVILVIASDDGIKDQTIEAIQHIKASEVPFIVCYTKIDKGSKNIENIRQKLLIHNVMVESLGGEILEVEVSATKRTNLDKLLEVLLLQSEMLELKANNKCMASGIVLESKLDKHKGPIATVLIKNGKLSYGDHFIVDNTYGKVRAMSLSNKKIVKEATASIPVEIMGLNAVPEPGSAFIEVENEKTAKEISEHRVSMSQKVIIKTEDEDLLDFFNEEDSNKINLIIKSDVSGSLEAILASVAKINYDTIDIVVVSKGNGAITESDVLLAKTSQSTIISFKVNAPSATVKLAEQHGIKIKKFSVIYELLDYVKGLAEGILAPTEEEEILGKAVIKEIFTKKKLGTIAGCGVEEGIIKLKTQGRVIRNGKEIYTGDIISLKQRQHDKVEVSANQECGIMISDYSDYRIGDTIESFIIKKLDKDDIN